ncbi:hypothetical protein ACWGOQ_0002580 [Aquimarina sp. M1]
MKKIFRILTLIQVGYYAYDMIKNNRSFKKEFVPKLKKVKQKLF